MAGNQNETLCAAFIPKENERMIGWRAVNHALSDQKKKIYIYFNTLFIQELFERSRPSIQNPSLTVRTFPGSVLLPKSLALNLLIEIFFEIMKRKNVENFLYANVVILF